MTIKKIELAWITVGDLAKARKFLTDTVGLKVASSAQEYGWMELQGVEGGMLLGVGQANSQHKERPGQNAVVTLTVDDIVASKKELESKGVQFDGDIMEVPGHVKMASFSDPDGNKFQLTQLLS